jgi:hypothetical protein
MSVGNDSRDLRAEDTLGFLGEGDFTTVPSAPMHSRGKWA